MVKGLEAVIPIGGDKGPHHFRHNQLAPLKHCCAPGELLLGGTMWAVARKQQEQSGHTGSDELESPLAVSPWHHRSGPKEELGTAETAEAGRAQACPGCCGVWRVQPCVCSPCSHWARAVSAKGWWPGLHVAVESTSCSCTHFVCPHIPILPHRVCHSSTCHPSRLQCPCANTEHLTWLCRGSLSEQVMTTGLLWCLSKPSHPVIIIHKKN